MVRHPLEQRIAPMNVMQVKAAVPGWCSMKINPVKP